jgi:HNH endonuclease/RuvC endonuclease subdomain 3
MDRLSRLTHPTGYCRGNSLKIMAITLAFDIGYASIGWCVLSSDKPSPADPEILGTGVVTFPTDDCLASQRRNLRRTRRHIRSTRMRIERMKRWLLHTGVLSREDLDRPGHPAPFLLAAAALQGLRTLCAWELWTVLRWYAHNRGYDGNSRWARGDEEPEDTEKVGNAIALMEKYQTASMAETICACLELKVSDHAAKISSALPYKTLNAAYPRKTVASEVAKLLYLHDGKITGLDAATVRMLMSSDDLGDDARIRLKVAEIKIPKRYMGGLLFGQLVPRFDNRIIARCPVTWAKTYDEALENGKSVPEAHHLADKYAKVPSAKCPEFFRFRFAMLLANLKIDNGQPLPKDLRQTIWTIAELQGRATFKDLAAAIKAAGHSPYNLDSYFKIHPTSEEALTLDPVVEYPNKNQIVKAVWPVVPETVREVILTRWRKGGSVTLEEIHQLSGSDAAVQKAIAVFFDKDQNKAKGKKSYNSIQDLLLRKLSPVATSGRAPYARPVLKAVVEEVLSGPYHPLKASRGTDPENGDDKPANGVLYDLGIPSSRVRQLQDERPLAKLTNNHLVRHRMLILERLLDDILAEFIKTPGEKTQVIVEVARDLREFSGMTAKQITSELNSRLKDFKAAVAYLDKFAPNLPRNGSIIRKCRIAMDLEWHCPYTGETYDVADLPKMERDHIIPFATRNTNSLHALVLTWPEVNRMKGKRTARQFIGEFEAKPVENKTNLSLFTARHYEEFVEKLKVTGHDDDRRRQKARKALLLTADFKDKELGFTEGQLTQSSQLMKLAMGAIKQKLPTATVDPIPGPVTSEIRKAWRLTGCLALACPEVIDATGEVLPKDEIRGLTHLHHALDAATLAFAAHYFPLRHRGQDQKGKIWQALLKRRRTNEEKEFLLSLGRIFQTYQRENADGRKDTDVRLVDLAPEVKNALARSLAQCRVMQHLPADRSGAKAELTTWGIVSIEGEGEDARVKLRQQSTKVENGVRLIKPKPGEERAGKLLGLNPKSGSGKLKAIKGVMVIGENYGLALDPQPQIIPFHDVQKRLDDVRAANGGMPVRVLRNGMLIRVNNWSGKNGLWRIQSCKASMKLDLAKPHEIKSSWREVMISSLLARGVEILPRCYTSFPSVE